MKHKNTKRKMVEIRDLNPLEHFCGRNNFHPWSVTLMPSSRPQQPKYPQAFCVAAEEEGEKGEKSSTLRNVGM